MPIRYSFAALALMLASGSAFAGITFNRIGVAPTVDPQNPSFSDAYGVSDTGTVVGSQHISGVGFRAFSWTQGGGRQQVDGINPNSGLFARSITPDGLVVVGENTGPGVAYRQVNGGAIESLGTGDPKFYDQTAANDVANDGSAVAGLLSRIEDGTFRAARWTQDSGWEDLGALPGDYESSGNTISADGKTVAGYSVGTYFTAVTWTKETGLQALPNPFNTFSNTAVIAMAADGSAFVGEAQDLSEKSQAVVWNANGTSNVLANVTGFDSGAAYGVSGDGSIIGGTVFIDQVGGDTAAFWGADGTAYNLKAYLEGEGIDLTGWNLLAVTEVSQNGLYLTGRGINPAGELEAFVVQIPAPGSGVLVLVGVGVLGRRRRALHAG